MLQPSHFRKTVICIDLICNRRLTTIFMGYYGDLIAKTN